MKVYQSLIHQRSSLLKLLDPLDPIGVVLFVHGMTLLVAGEVEDPQAGSVVLAAFVAWRLAMKFSTSTSGRGSGWLPFVTHGGSLVLAGAMMAVDGGPDSPFLFWMLLLLAWQALVLPVLTFVVMALVATGAYVAAVFLTDGFTSTALTRILLIAAFAAVLGLGRYLLEREHSAGEDLAHLLVEMFADSPLGLAMVQVSPLEVVASNTAAERVGFLDLINEASVSEMIQRAHTTMETVGPVVAVLRHDGSERHLRMTAVPHLRRNTGVVSVGIEDVTAQVEAGEERRRFLQLASHQLRTPLTPVIGYSRLILDGDLEPEVRREAANEILGAGLRLQRLFDRMLAVTRLQHQSSATASAVSMGEILDLICREQIGGIEGVVVRGDADVRVTCPPRAVAAALAELFDNSRRFGAGPVHLSWAVDGDDLLIRQWDEGRGPELDESELFGDWGKVKSVDLMPEGMGTRLGLLHARLLLAHGGGRIGLHRGDGSWAFSIRLPLAAPSMAPDAAEPIPGGGLAGVR